MPWREKKYTTVGGHSWRGGLFTKQLKKWVKAVFLLGCYGYIFHGTGNSTQLCQNFGISGGGWTPQLPPPRYATEANSPFFAILRTRLKITGYALKYPCNVTAGAEIGRKIAGISLLMTTVKFQHSGRKGDCIRFKIMIRCAPSNRLWASPCSPPPRSVARHSKQNHPPTTVYQLSDWCSVQHPDRNVTNRKWRRHIVVVTPTLLVKDRKWSEKCQTSPFYYLSCTVEFYLNLSCYM